MVSFLDQGKHIRVTKYRVARIGPAREGQVDLGLVHLCVICRLMDEFGDDVALGVVHSLARALSIGLRNLAAVGKNGRV